MNSFEITLWDKREKEEEISIILTGDFCPINSSEVSSFNNNSDLIYGEYKEILFQKDLSITNLECVLTKNIAKLHKTGPCLKASPNAIKVVKAGGFDIACLANNHIMDFCAEGLEDTLQSCRDNDILTVGADVNYKKARKGLEVFVKDQLVIILNYAEEEFSIASEDIAGANPFDIINVIDDIQEAKKKTEIVIVIVHGGIEGYNLPSPLFHKKLKHIAKYKPTAIICHHSHTYSGYEIENKIPVFYSLGNFIFDYGADRDISWHKGYFVKIKVGLISKRVNSFDIFPYNQNKIKPGIYSMSSKELIEFKESLKDLNDIIKNEFAVKEEFVKYVKKNGISRYHFIINKNLFFRRVYRYFKPFKIIVDFFHNRTSIFGMINSDSHREVLVKYLRNKR